MGGWIMSKKERDYGIYLARQGLKHYLETGQTMKTPKSIPPLFQAKRGTFVSIKTKNGQLRGCIGTLEPTQKNLAEEIIQNAVSAGTSDPRFLPIEIPELEDLRISVDVIAPLEEVSSESELDPKKYGVVIEKDGARGVLLPDLPGVSRAREQVRIAADKAGIYDEKQARLYRFEVIRLAE